MGARPEVYVLMCHEPYSAPEHPVPINVTIAHAESLLLPGIPQPDGTRLYRALVEQPGRRAGEIVPLATVTSEVGGNLAAYAPRWEEVKKALVQATRDRCCDAMPTGVRDEDVALLSLPPSGFLTVHEPTGRRQLGPRDRERLVRQLEGYLATMTREAPFWSGR